MKVERKVTERGGYFFYFEIKIVAAVVYGEYTRFDLIESRYQGKDIQTVLDMKERQKEIINMEQQQSIQSEIDLVSHIQAIKHNAATETSPDVKNMRETREEERKRKHINYAKEAGLHDN